MSAETSSTAPTSRLTGKRPPSTAGATASMTTVRRGASIGATVTRASRREIEAERVGERQQGRARVEALAPELEEAVLGRPVSVADVEVPRALDERDDPGDPLARGRRGDGRDGRDDRAVHEEPHRREVQREPEPARLVHDGEDARGDLAELRQPLERVGGLPLQHVPRGQRERVGDGRVLLAEVVYELSVLLPDAPVRLLVRLEQRPDDAGQHPPALLQEQVAPRAYHAR